MMVLSDVGFGYHDSQTLCQLTSLCAAFIKERVYSNNPRRLEDFNMTLYKPLQALTRSPRSCKKTVQSASACFQGVGEHFQRML